MSFDFSADPFENLMKGLQEAKSPEALKAGISEPTAMALATASADGIPSVRTVLFKGLLRGGLSFYTNYESNKAAQLAENPRAMLLFFWQPLYRQIHISGIVDKVTREESEKYFATRSRLSQIGAWASEQSKIIPNVEYLNERVQKYEKQFQNQQIPCPPNWGGYRLQPTKFEFWFGAEARLHKRYVYQRETLTSPWEKTTISP